MNRILPGLVIILLATPAMADDITFPPRRPGLWEHTMMTGAITTTSKTCIDAATDHAMLQHGIDVMRQNGGTVTVTGSGNQVHIASSADMGGHAVTMSEDFTLIDDATMQGRGHMHIDPPFVPSQTDIDIRQDSHWTGPCPADMQPGDAIANGSRMNLLQGK